MLTAGDFSRAVDLLEGQAETDPSGESLVLLGDARFLSGEYDRAEEAWRAALAHLPSSPDLAEKLERAAANLVTRIAIDEPQMEIFGRPFSRDVLLNGPHPGNVGDHLFPKPSDPRLFDRIRGDVETGAGVALTSLWKAVLQRLTERPGSTMGFGPTGM